MSSPNVGTSVPAVFIATLENRIRKVLYDASQLRTLDALSSAKTAIKTAQKIISKYEERSIDADLPLVLQFVFLMVSKDGEIDVLELAKSVKELEDSVSGTNDSERRDSVDTRVMSQSDPPAGSTSNGIVPGKRRRTTIDTYLVADTSAFNIGDRVLYDEMCDECIKMSQKGVDIVCEGTWGMGCSPCAAKKGHCSYSRGRGMNKSASLVENSVADAGQAGRPPRKQARLNQQEKDSPSSAGQSSSLQKKKVASDLTSTTGRDVRSARSPDKATSSCLPPNNQALIKTLEQQRSLTLKSVEGVSQLQEHAQATYEQSKVHLRDLKKNLSSIESRLQTLGWTPPNDS